MIPALAVFQGGAQLGVDEGTVRQSGERVVLRLVLQRPPGFVPFGHVAGQREDEIPPPGFELHVRPLELDDAAILGRDRSRERFGLLALQSLEEVGR